MDLMRYCEDLPPTPAVTSAAELNPSCIDIPFAMGRQFLAPRAAIVFSLVPKVASSALKYALVEAEYPWLIERHGGAQNMRDRVHHFDGLLTLKGLAQTAGATTVRILRDPVRRAVSAYVNKFIVDIEPGITRPICGFVHKPQGEVTFEDFLWYLVNAPNFWLDPHFRPQADFFPFAHYDHTFNMDAGATGGGPPLADFVQDRLGVPLRRINDSGQRLRTAARGIYCGNLPAASFYASETGELALPPADEFLNEATRKALRLRYLDDCRIIEATLG